MAGAKTRRWAALLVVLPALIWLVTVVLREERETTAPMTLKTSSPAAGAVLSTAPGGVDLTWSAPVDARLSHVVVEDSNGAQVPSGTLSTGPVDVLHLPLTDGAKGIYTLGWHVVGTDGGEATGSIRFSVDAGPVPDGPAPAVETHNHGIDPASAVLLLVNFAVVAGAVVMLLLRPSPRRRVKL